MEQENFWVIAESGYWLLAKERRQWTELFKVQNKSWMHTIRLIMAQYCDNIDGSYIEERSCSIIWDYKNTEDEHGSKNAIALSQQLQHLLGRNSPVEIIHCNGFIEVLPKKLNKKAVLGNMLENLKHYCNHQLESFLFIGHY